MKGTFVDMAVGIIIRDAGAHDQGLRILPLDRCDQGNALPAVHIGTRLGWNKKGVTDVQLTHAQRGRLFAEPAPLRTATLALNRA